MGMKKSNVYNWIKKTEPVAENSYKKLEMDEMYRFIFRKPRAKTRENVYIMLNVSREISQIAGFDAAYDKAPERIQHIVDNSPSGQEYFTDGYLGYIDVVYPGKHIRNTCDKSDTFTVEGVNADLRHYIPILARRSRCFPRTIDTLLAVIKVFVQAYNLFGAAKYKYRLKHKTKETPFTFVSFL